jgi:hypothetical protein
MSVKEFALAQADRLVSFDAGVERPIAKRVALRANLHSPNNGIDHGGAAKFPGRDQCARTSRQQELPCVTS